MNGSFFPHRGTSAPLPKPLLGFRRGIPIVLAILATLHQLAAQGKLLPVIQFQHLTTANGLPSNDISSNVVRDRQGFIWVGTNNGLARYDGYTSKVYRNNPGDPHSLSPNSVVTLFVDSKGRLWIGKYQNGLSLYDPQNDRFVNFLPRENDSLWFQAQNIMSIYEDESGVIWLGSAYPQVVRVDLGPAKNETNADSVARHLQFRTIPFNGFGDWVQRLDRWDDSNIIVGSSAGLFIINCETHEVARPGLPPLPGVNLDTVATKCLFWENPSRLWIGTLLHGLYLYDRANGSLTGYHKRRQTGVAAADNRIEYIQLDKSARLWLATYEGINLFDTRSRTYVDYATSSGAPTNSWWTTISCDDAGTVWVSTGNDGVYLLPPASFRFPRYALKGSSGTPMEMETIDRWSDSSYWIGAEGEVVNVRLEDLSVIERVNLFKGNKSLYGPAGVHASYNDEKGKLWYGTWGLGLYSFEPRIRQVRNWRYSTQLTDLANREDVCRSILGVGDDLLWIAAEDDELLCFNTSTNRFSKVPNISMGQAAHLMRDNTGNIWLSDEYRHLLVYDPSAQLITQFVNDPDDPASVSDNSPQKTYQDPQGKIWVGCKDLNLWEPDTRSFKRFLNPIFAGARHVIPLGSDSQGRLWLHYEENGLSILDPRTAHFTNFDSSDGLVSPINMMTLQDGRVMLVGRGGMNMIHPDSLFALQPAPPFVISRLSINDTIDVPLQGIPTGLARYLPYNQNTLEFEFAAMDPATSHRVQYFFRLEGLEDSWVYPGNRRFVRYAGLNPGDYVFRVKAVDAFARWPVQEIAVALSIAPPWWRTTWAYAAYGLLCAAFLFGAYRLRLRQIQLKQAAEMEHFQAEHLVKVDRLKSRFFSNISHEFRTPLTLILGPADQLIESAPESSSHQKLHLIRDNAKKLLDLVNQLLDFSRLESGMMRLQVSRGDVVQFLRRVVMSFESWAESKKIDLGFKSDAESADGFFDRDKLEKIVNNLMSNALKFTPEGGGVTVTVTQFRTQKSELITQNSIPRSGIAIAVSDTGPGIAPEHLPHIFDRFYRVDETHTTEGTGIGLALIKELVELHHGTITVESTPGKGSVFTVVLPVEKSAYKPDEISETPSEQEGHEHIEVAAPLLESDTLPSRISAEGKPSVLVVEDNSDLRVYIREYLERDYAVYEAGDGNEGYDAAVEIVPDLVISDIMMPGMDGIELCRALKQDVRTSHVPVILLTARAGTDSKIEGLETGADDYVTKPFDSKELVARVRNLVEQRRQLRKTFSAGVVLRPGEVAVSSLDDALLKKVMETVENNIENENFGVEELARQVSLSQRHLDRKLLGLTNLSPNDFIRYIRLQRAHELLEKGVGSVTEIAYQVGFGSSAYFSTCFRKRFGYSPSEIRKRNT